MAKRTRRNTKSVYERIEETLVKIEETEKVLSDLRELLDELYAEKDDLEMRQTWATINEMGLSMEDLSKLLSNQFISQIKDNKEEYTEQKEEENTENASTKKSTKKEEKDKYVDNNTGEEVNL